MKKIFIVKLGWVFIGDEKETRNGVITVENASVVRVWGTERGIGELAIKGPTKKTVLDRVGTIEIQEASLLARIRCLV